MSFDIILDLIVICCLGATIAFAVRLNRKLATIYKSREEIQAFLNQFTESMSKADASIKDLRGVGESVFKTAQKEMDDARALKDDLAFLNERGEELAERLDGSIRVARTLYKELEDRAVGVAPVASNASRYEEASQPELVRHLQNVR
jgi:hypothetical protein